MSEHAMCALCELEGHDDVIHLRAVEWREPIGDRWEAVNRCRDRIACRLRVEASTDDEGRPLVWPLIDSARDLEAWENRGKAPEPMPVAPAPATSAIAVAEPPPPLPAEPPTWVAPFVDEPEEEPWP